MKFKKIVALMLTAIAALSTAVVAGCNNKNLSETENKLLTSAMAEENEKNLLTNETKEFYISDFLSTDAKSVQASIYPYFLKWDIDPEIYGFSGSVVDAYVWPESKELNAIIDLFGEIKLDTFDIETKTNIEKQEFYLSEACADFDMLLEFDDGSYTKIYINDYEKDNSEPNLFVQYNYTKNENKIHKCFTASISKETKNSLVDFIKNLYESKKEKN